MNNCEVLQYADSCSDRTHCRACRSLCTGDRNDLHSFERQAVRRADSQNFYDHMEHRNSVDSDHRTVIVSRLQTICKEKMRLVWAAEVFWLWI